MIKKSFGSLYQFFCDRYAVEKRYFIGFVLFIPVGLALGLYLANHYPLIMIMLFLLFAGPVVIYAVFSKKGARNTFPFADKFPMINALILSLCFSLMLSFFIF